MINLVVALPVEARPLIAHFGLLPVFTHGPFRCYQSNDTFLVVSGVGKLNAAAAVAYLHALEGGKVGDIWLNIGTAGHDNLQVGSGYLAASILDADTNKKWVPMQLSDEKLATIHLVSLARPTDSYGGNFTYDLEASAFFEIAQRCSREGMVQCFKIISDNLSSNMKQVSAKLMEQLVKKRMTDIERLLTVIT